MTPELRAAAERVRRVAAVGQHSADMRIHLADLYALATAYLAEHPADDDEPVTLDDLADYMHDPMFPPIHNERGWFVYVNVSAYVPVKTKGDVLALQKGLGR